MKDPYQVLGVARAASADDIKKAYRKLARSMHPDMNPGNKHAEDRFKDISAAYDLLSDPAKKARYDRGEIDASGAERPRHHYRSHAAGSGAGAGFGGFGGRFRDFDVGGSFDADDILSDIFGRRTGARGRGPARGANQHYSLTVSFVDAALGATKRITLPMGKSLDVRIPPGSDDGQTLRLKGQGAPGAGGGAAGDALIELTVEPHPFFKREGRDIHLELPVTLPEAVLGAKVTVPTLEGRVALTVPPGSNTGAILRLKGKGIPGTHQCGDQYVRLKVMLPDKPDAELQEFLNKWARSHDYDVRGKAGMA